MGKTGSENERKDRYTRRSFVRMALGVAGVGLLSACGGNPSTGGEKSSDSATTSTQVPTVDAPNHPPAGEISTRVPASGTTVSSKPTPPKQATKGSRYIADFLSRPNFRPPVIEVTVQARDTAPGYVFIAPKKGASQSGPMIVDNDGRMVWFHPLEGNNDATCFKVWSYQDKPVLAWSQGKISQGHGQCEYVIADTSYDKITTVKAGNGYRGDLHDFVITDRDTALFTIYNDVAKDLSSFGGPRDGAVMDGIIQEVDIRSGKVLFEWHSLDHVGLDESYWKVPKSTKKKAFDYFHINSVDVTSDGNLLISARNTWAAYKVNRKSGEIMWRLGGKKSDFEMGKGAQAAYQHDVRWHADDVITIFDNGGSPMVHEQSRGIILKLDTDKMKATLVREYVHPDKLKGPFQGNMQLLPNGNVFIGWGTNQHFSEFDKSGDLIFDARFPPKVDSYRAFRCEWHAHPREKPAIVAKTGPGGDAKLYASWNGATEVDTWEALTGNSKKKLAPVASARWSGFETALTVKNPKRYVTVQPRGKNGRVLGTSRRMKL